MNMSWVAALAAISLASIASAEANHANKTTLEAMPPKLETQFALSAAPPRLRDAASIYLLDPAKGYYLSRQGTSGVTCIVQRTDWEMPDLRDDVYWPVCYDAEGTKTYLKTIMDAAALRAQGVSAAAMKAEIAKRYRDKTYKVPDKAGVSYIVGPLMRAVGPPDMQVHTMAMPHLMFYAPFVTNEDIGAAPDFNDRSSLAYPFLDKHTEGGAEHSYIIQLLGEAETAKILGHEKQLITDLCAYRDVLCLEHAKH
jgi:hypothetical protein